MRQYGNSHMSAVWQQLATQHDACVALKHYYIFMLYHIAMADVGDFNMCIDGGSMPVSGIVLTCAASSAEYVAQQLSGFSGVEIHGVLPDGKIVAVLEADTVDGEVALVTELQDMAGVVSVQLAYHNFEDFDAE